MTRRLFFSPRVSRDIFVWVLLPYSTEFLDFQKIQVLPIGLFLNADRGKVPPSNQIIIIIIKRAGPSDSF